MRASGVCEIASCATLLLIMTSLTLTFEGEPWQPPPPCACVCQSGCACMLMLACQSKPPLGSQSHQLLIKLVCRGSTSVLTDVTDAGKCISVCIGAAAVDFYAISAE